MVSAGFNVLSGTDTSSKTMPLATSERLRTVIKFSTQETAGSGGSILAGVSNLRISGLKLVFTRRGKELLDLILFQ
jgi:hypothetical protein